MSSPSEPLDLDEAAAILADNGVDGPDLPYNPRALAAMRIADALLSEVRDLREEQHAEDQLRARMDDLLTRTAAALKGEPGPLVMHDWSDLPAVAAALVAERDQHRAAVRRAQKAIRDGAITAGSVALAMVTKGDPGE